MEYIKDKDGKGHEYKCKSCSAKIIMTEEEEDTLNEFSLLMSEVNILDVMDMYIKCCDHPSWKHI